jgi:3-dehydroquinate dehydratase/shikimate dehydrogenase
MICLSLTGNTLSECREQLLRNRQHVDLAELRVDLLDPDEQGRAGRFPELAASGGFSGSLILTVRRQRDGGAWAGSEADRVSLLTATAGPGFSYVDLESELRETEAGQRLAADARESGSRIIRSVHDTAGQSGNIRSLLEELSAGGEIAKLAVTPRSTQDLVDLLTAADRTSHIEKILIGMGPFGTPSRILAGRFGSLLSFTSEPGGRQAAPGQIGPEQLNTLYRFHAIDANTRFFAVIGSPVHHSKSPEYHNGRFAKDGLNACYVPILVDDAGAFFALADLLPLHGVSVTIPHKQTVLRRIAVTDEGCRATGACNTLIRAGEAWQGVNTDVSGFLAPLERHFPSGLSGIGVTVIGAGGAARAIVYALLSSGARVLVLNRTPERASELIESVTRRLPPAEHDADAVAQEEGPAAVAAALAPGTSLEHHADLIVQTTSVGMHGEGDPIPWYRFDGREVMYDIVYTPPQTPVITRAREAGCATITGDTMFEAQADAQYRLFSRLASA